MKKQKFKKKIEERLRNLQDNFKCSTIWNMGCQEEEEEQEIENLFEKIMKENFPNLAKEMDFKEIQETVRVPKKLDPRKHTPRHIIITLPKIKENLKSSKRKEDSYLQRSSHQTISWFLKRNLAGKKGLERRILSHERQGPTCKVTLSSKAII